MVCLADGEKKSDAMFSRFDRISLCDRRTDGWTSCDSKVRVMQSIARKNYKAYSYN